MTTTLPIIMLFNHDLEKIQACGFQRGKGVAQLIDVINGVPEIIHLFPFGDSSNSPDRTSIPLEWQINENGSSKVKTKRKTPSVLIRINTHSSSVVSSCDLHLSQLKLMECPVNIIQTGTASFTRNKAILETSVLNSFSILCIGLGSGGSIVIDQLARAGIGRFSLWDMDRLESHNIGRHLCTLRDIGRSKVFAVRDHIKLVNPGADVKCINENVLQSLGPDGKLEAEIAATDCIIIATDNNASRYAINEIAWQHHKVAIYGRAYTRASGGDVIQVIPGLTPCYACHTDIRVVEEEISSQRDVDRVAYADKIVPIEPGLMIDIHPIANMVARLVLLRLCEKIDSSLRPVAEETAAPLYLWANRREGQFKNWLPMERTYSRLSIFRWYAINVLNDKECMICRCSTEK